MAVNCTATEPKDSLCATQTTPGEMQSAGAHAAKTHGTSNQSSPPPFPRVRTASTVEPHCEKKPSPASKGLLLLQPRTPHEQNAKQARGNVPRAWLRCSRCPAPVCLCRKPGEYEAKRHSIVHSSARRMGGPTSRRTFKGHEGVLLVERQQLAAVPAEHLVVRLDKRLTNLFKGRIHLRIGWWVWVCW